MTNYARLPIVQSVETRLDDDARSQLRGLASRMRVEAPDIGPGAFGEGISSGLGPSPFVTIEDHSWIALASREAANAQSHRARMLAGTGDVVIVGGRRCPAFEAYCRDVLGLGDPLVLAPGPAAEHRSLGIACVRDEAVLGQLVDVARRHGALTILPYMGTGGVWRLAAAISEKARTPVQVAAPPPRLVRRVNDKLWFARCAAAILGERSLPDARPVFGAAALAVRLRELADRHPGIAIKLPDSAGGLGNIVLVSDALRDLPARSVRDNVLARLRLAGWAGRFPLMVTAWEQPVLASPSAHLWIPAMPDGDPVFEGVFDQMIGGAGGHFAGAVPSALPRALLQRLADESVRIGYVFQQLGYFGRCSLDAVVIGEDPIAAQVHWVDCNGRWGGVSIPLTLTNRLTGDWRTHPFVVAVRSRTAFRPREFGAFLDEFADDLFRPERPRGLVATTPTRIEEGVGFELVVIGETREAAAAHAHDVTQRLLGES